ncbi:putative transposase [Shigella flexneri VA-6]|nr:putative transposase [Shigella flexneri VA-6]STF37129.1 transposase [Escherichia coli]
MIDVLGPEKRRRRTTQEKIAIVQQSFEPGMTVSLVAPATWCSSQPVISLA